MITAPLPRASPSGSGRLSMIIPQNHGLTITYCTLGREYFPRPPAREIFLPWVQYTDIPLGKVEYLV